MKVVNLYKKYIDSKRATWSEASIRSEELRLNKIMDLINGDAPALWTELGHRYNKHTRVTTFNRVVSFCEWAVKNKHLKTNPYAAFREENPNCFRNFYERRPPGMTFIETKTRLMTLREPFRNKGLQLLTSGMRWSESFTLTPDGYVLGKGGKTRKVYPMPGLGPMCAKADYRAFLRQLKKLGIKGPHRLRGIFLTECVRRKMDTFELKEVAGWSSLDTASSYIAVNQERIMSKVSEIHEGVTP